MKKRPAIKCQAFPFLCRFQFMPELPEVEVTRRGLAPAIVGRCVSAVNIRTPKLREPFQDLAALLPGLTLEHLERRAKYLIWTFRSAAGEKRWLLTHMGMSGSWRIWPVPPNRL